MNWEAKERDASPARGDKREGRSEVREEKNGRQDRDEIHGKVGTELSDRVDDGVSHSRMRVVDERADELDDLR